MDQGFRNRLREQEIREHSIMIPNIEDHRRLGIKRARGSRPWRSRHQPIERLGIELKDWLVKM
jgi:hypothetical protein